MAPRFHTHLHPDYVAQFHGAHPGPLADAQPFGSGPLEAAWQGQGSQPFTSPPAMSRRPSLTMAPWPGGAPARTG